MSLVSFVANLFVCAYMQSPCLPGALMNTKLPASSDLRSPPASSRAEGVRPRLPDAMQPIKLRRTGLSGEIGRRVCDLIYQNYMAIDLDRDFVAPFRSRPFSDGSYVGVGKVIDAGSHFAEYTQDAQVAERTARSIEDDRHPRSRRLHRRVQTGAGRRQNHRLGPAPAGVPAARTGPPLSGVRRCQVVERARELGDYVVRTFSLDPKPGEVCTAGLPRPFCFCMVAPRTRGI